MSRPLPPNPLQPAIKRNTQALQRLEDSVATLTLAVNCVDSRAYGALTERVRQLELEKSTLIRWLLNARRELRARI